MSTLGRMEKKMSTLSLILEKYGILLSLEQVGDLLHRSPPAVRQAIARGAGIGEALKSACIKRGRRLYFRANDLAEIIDKGEI